MSKKTVKRTIAAVAAVAGLLAFTSLSQARQQIQVVGSSTVLPYARIVAETFGETFDDFKTPVIETGGSGAGIKEFCRGVGDNTVDIANASRPMKPSELQSCVDSGVNAVQEIRFGYDAVAFASDINGPDWQFEPQDVYRALAAQLVIEGQLIANPLNNWHEIDTKFPNVEIVAFIPGEKHGTREVLEEKLMIAGCKASGAFDVLQAAGLDDRIITAACIAVRKDGKVVDIDGDYAETLARIDADKSGIGVFGLSFYENNADRLKLATISDVTPSVETIVTGDYPLSRSLYFYVKQAHLEIVPGLRDYVEFFLSDEMSGETSPLADYGLIPLPDKEREAVHAAFTAGDIMALD